MTVKQLLWHSLFAAASVCGHADEIDLSHFPGVENYSDQTIRLHGLAQLFPGRVLFEDPKLKSPSATQEAARVEDLSRGIKYIRLYRLDEAYRVLEAHKDHPALILDFRYLKSEAAAVKSLHLFAREEWASAITPLGQVPPNLIEATETPTSVREKPVIVLVNRETAGPFEATLHQLQQKGTILAIGEPTAGRTGFYKQTTQGASWVLNGEILPDGETSLVGVGFHPRIVIETNPEENYLAYYLYEAGTTIDLHLRHDETLPEDPETSADPPQPDEPDRVLQRGVDIVAALQILQ